ncbi:MAG: tRNA (5-methylaminomethyl-2-thiouridine)(34)-methyltransferase MnmD [Bacteroidota bacterium]
MKREIVLTADGSHTLHHAELNEHYHSIHGAVQESKHVFIGAGLSYCLGRMDAAPAILEIGFGTGLNALLTLQEAEKLKRPVAYDSLEAYPLESEVTGKLNYGQLLSDQGTFCRLHECPWNQPLAITPFFTLTKINSAVQEFIPSLAYDLVYFDAFAPSRQPEMWTAAVFEKLFGSMKKGAVLVTYCAQGNVKRTLRSAGFELQALKGPPGKREMTRATKP